MKIIISNASNLPLYQQIKEQIKSAIFKGDIKEGEKLPSIRGLANDLRVSVLTTKRVYMELEAEGFIITKAGKGSYVAPDNLELLLESKRRVVEEKLTETWNVARNLGISKKELYDMMDLIFDEEEINNE
jgi:GntR family transcriptional regulator